MSGEAYSKRYGSGGFVDLPSQTTSIDSQFLNGVEAALARLLGADPTDAMVQVWDAALGRFKTVKLTANNLDPAAAIAKTQLAPLAIVDTDVAPGANIASSKIGGNIPISKLTGFPNDVTKKLMGDGSWSISVPPTMQVFGAGSGTYTLPAGCKALLVEMIAAGGAGGGAPITAAGQNGSGGGGGGGGYGLQLIASPSATIGYSVGAGGTGVVGAGGNAGGPTSFASFSATGGNGGQAAAAYTPPNYGGSGGGGGIGVGCILNIRGVSGDRGVGLTAASILTVVGGAAARGGSGGPTQFTNTAAGTAGLPYGGGGGGGGNAQSQAAAVAGGAGADGVILVWEFY